MGFPRRPPRLLVCFQALRMIIIIIFNLYRNIGFPDTQEAIEINREAEERRAAKEARMEMESRCVFPTILSQYLTLVPVNRMENTSVDRVL